MYKRRFQGEMLKSLRALAAAREGTREARQAEWKRAPASRSRVLGRERRGAGTPAYDRLHTVVFIAGSSLGEASPE